MIAAMCISLILYFKTGFKRNVLRENMVAYALLGGVGIAGFNGALFVGLQTADPVTAALIMSTTPLSANLLEALVNRCWPDQWRIIGTLMSLIGVTLVVSNGTFFMGNSFVLVPGDLFLVLGSLVWAAYTVGCRSFVKNSSPLETTAWTMISGAITLVVIAFVLEQPMSAIARGTLVSHLSTVYMAIPGAVLAYLFFVIGVSVRGSGRTAIFLNLVPVFALFISIIQGHTPSETQALGVIVTILGVLVGDGLVMVALKRVRAMP